MRKNGCHVSVSLSCNARFVSSVLSMRASRKKHALCIISAFKTTHRFLYFVVGSRVVNSLCSRGFKCSGPSIAIERVIWAALKKGCRPLR